MMPAARRQAVIENIDEIEATLQDGGPAADVILRRYFSARRYAGSKDRAAITNETYDILRHRAELLWVLEKAAGPEARGRVLVLAKLAWLDRLGLDDINALFSGEGHGPAPLTSDETALVERIALVTDTPPEAVHLECPAWLEPLFRARFGESFATEMAALQGRAAVGLRVNTLKTTVEAAITALAVEGITASPAEFAPNGLVVEGNPRLEATSLLRDGWVEIQDIGSQIAAALIDIQPRQQVADLCAGAGGKTLAAAAAMANSGQIYAFDTDARRLGNLKERLKRADARNIQTHRVPEQGDKRATILGEFTGRMDRVVVDVPCSGSGTWRRNPELRWRFSDSELERLNAVQDRLLDEGAALLKAGGRLIYITCSLLREEDEDRITAFLAREPEFRAVPYTAAWPEDAGPCPETTAADPVYLLLTPAKYGTDGFFVAVLERQPEVAGDAADAS